MNKMSSTSHKSEFYRSRRKLGNLDYSNTKSNLTPNRKVSEESMNETKAKYQQYYSNIMKRTLQSKIGGTSSSQIQFLSPKASSVNKNLLKNFIKREKEDFSITAPSDKPKPQIKKSHHKKSHSFNPLVLKIERNFKKKLFQEEHHTTDNETPLNISEVKSATDKEGDRTLEKYPHYSQAKRTNDLVKRSKMKLKKLQKRSTSSKSNLSGLNLEGKRPNKKKKQERINRILRSVSYSQLQNGSMQNSGPANNTDRAERLQKYALYQRESFKSSKNSEKVRRLKRTQSFFPSKTCDKLHINIDNVSKKKRLQIQTKNHTYHISHSKLSKMKPHSTKNVSHWQKQFSSFKQHQKISEASITKLQEELKKKDQELKSAYLEKAKLKNSVSHFKTELERSTIECDDLRTQLKRMFKEKLEQSKIFKSQISNLSLQHSILTQKVEEYQSQMDEMQERIDKLIIENTVIRTKYSFKDNEKESNDDHLQMELDNATPYNNNYLEYAPSLQEIKEVESEMYHSDRWNRENGSFQNSLKSMKSKDGTQLKNSLDGSDGVVSSKKPLRQLAIEKSMDKQEIERRIEGRFKSEISQLKFEIKMLKQRLKQSNFSFESTKQQLEIESGQKVILSEQCKYLDSRRRELEMDLKLERVLVQEMKKLVKNHQNEQQSQSFHNVNQVRGMGPNIDML